MNRTVMPSSAGDTTALDALSSVLSDDGDVYVAIPGSSSSRGVRLPDELRAVLIDAVTALSRGNAVTVEPHRTVLTTQEAAELLGITRPTLVRLLDAGKIPFTTPGRHRRVELADVLAYRENLRVARRVALEAMAADATPDPPDSLDGHSRTR